MLGSALFGAIIGGTSAAAKAIRKVNNGEAGRDEAVMDVAREAGTTAVAAGTAGAVVGTLNIGPILSALGIIAVATGTKYAMDSITGSFSASRTPAPKNHASLILPEPEKDSASDKQESADEETGKAKIITAAVKDTPDTNK